MGNHFSCIRGDSKKPSKKWVRRKPYSTTTVTSSSTFSEILRRYSLYTTQHWRHHGFWRKKKVNPQEASRESPAHRGREVGERPVNVRLPVRTLYMTSLMRTLYKTSLTRTLYTTSLMTLYMTSLLRTLYMTSLMRTLYTTLLIRVLYKTSVKKKRPPRSHLYWRMI
nr:uncharacterized protein LOC129467697 isoform X4 [Symphalangus syndactylus]XP_055108359.1 uncharacterized protein LOC129467697 isoform X4 [Symphalangus syndactylus]XP_055108360.1 uncharacterized protein LOC129467697 isoform X4 [Symphalangus syndactylus]